jgi:DNA primase
VIVCEGEKDCKYLYKIGFCGTTSPMGADSAKTAIEDDGKPGHADWSPLADDKKTVILWGDFDEPGRRHIERVKRILMRLDPRPTIKMVRKEDVGNCKDAADFIANYTEDALQQVLLVIGNAEEVLTSKPLLERFEDIYSGKYVAESWPFPILSE